MRPSLEWAPDNQQKTNTEFQTGLLHEMMLRAICMGPVTGSINALTAEVAVYTKNKEGLSIEGSIYSCVSVGQKVGGGLGTAISGWLLALGGYDGLAAVQPLWQCK